MLIVALIAAFGPWFGVGLLALLLVRPLRRSLAGWRWWRLIAVAAGLVVVATAGFWLTPRGMLPIPPGPGMLVGPHYVGSAVTPQPIAGLEIPDSPVMAPTGRNSMHNDLWSTDAYTWAGPLGKNPQVRTAWYGIKECATLAFDSHDRMVALCGDLKGPIMHIIDPDTMRLQATMRLPDRQPSADGVQPWEDLCGGAYFYLNADDEAVVATTDHRILVTSTSDEQGAPEIKQLASHDLAEFIPADDCLIALMPDWDGTVFWITRHGIVGTLNLDSGQVRIHDTGEEIANSMAADEEGGVYVVTVEALYRFVADEAGAPAVHWRTTYDRGSQHKPGMLSQGSGNTPTVLPEMVAIGDNADPQMNIIFYDRSSGAKLCQAPVFEQGRSASENALVAVGPSSVVVENNYGYTSPVATMFGRTTTPGFARVDATVGANGQAECEVAWTSSEVGPTSVPKSSLATGLVYAYTKKPSWLGVNKWYFTGIDAATGKTAFSVRTGTGTLVNNHYAAVTIAPNGVAFIATPAGLVRISDQE